jgi:hypothetical protein
MFFLLEHIAPVRVTAPIRNAVGQVNAIHRVRFQNAFRFQVLAVMLLQLASIPDV